MAISRTKSAPTHFNTIVQADAPQVETEGTNEFCPQS